jgi:hypothetical protein
MAQTKVGYFTKLDPELREAMRRYKEAVGVPEAQQIERALREWLRARPEAWAPAPMKAVAKASRPRQRRRERGKKDQR